MIGMGKYIPGTFEIEVTHGNKEGCKGTNFCIAFIGVIK
jgi:hypothetical protein